MSKQQISLAGVIGLIEAGKSRTAIGEHYGLNKSDVDRMFKHPDLKGRRQKKEAAFTLIEDWKEGDAIVEPMSEPVAEEVHEHLPEAEGLLLSETPTEEVFNQEVVNTPVEPVAEGNGIFQ